MNNWYQHRSNPAKPGPAHDPVPSGTPVRPPKWRIWLVVAGVVLTFSLFARPAMTKGATPNQNFSFTEFVTHVDANQVKTATVAPDGHVSGTLTNGHRYTSQVPTAIPDSQLAGQLQDHNVQVTGTTGAGVSALGVFVNLLPLLLLVGLFVWISRRGRALAGGITSVGRSKARRLRPRRLPYDPLRRCRRLPGGQAGSHRSGRLPQTPRQIPPRWRGRTPGCAHGRSARHRQTLMARAVAGEAGVRA